MRDDCESPVLYAVLDPAADGNRSIIEAVGTDAIAVRCRRPVWADTIPLMLVDNRALGPARLIRLCRYLARRNGIGFAMAYMEAIQGRGISIPARGCYVCRDPEVGRGFFADRDREGRS